MRTSLQITSTAPKCQSKSVSCAVFSIIIIQLEGKKKKKNHRLNDVTLRAYVVKQGLEGNFFFIYLFLGDNQKTLSLGQILSLE